jgi:DNA adenine methylase
MTASVLYTPFVPSAPTPDAAAFRLAPPLKWAGGKRWQVPHVRALWEAHRGRRLVEPFCGGLAVALGLMPENALLNDINPHVVNFYGWLQRGLRVGIRLENDAAVYYAHRARFNELLAAGRASSRECAELFYYLNRTGYNGLCRFNRRGAFNVPFGRYKTIAYLRDFHAFRQAFAGWRFTNTDLEKISLSHDDFVYADPPYDVEFRSYAKEGFTWDDQVRTAGWLARHPGPVILVNQATPRIQGLYRDLGYRVSLMRAPRRISCNGDRTPAEEVFATRNMES